MSAYGLRNRWPTEKIDPKIAAAAQRTENDFKAQVAQLEAQVAQLKASYSQLKAKIEQIATRLTLVAGNGNR
jgi:phage shock protein A